MLGYLRKGSNSVFLVSKHEQNIFYHVISMRREKFKLLYNLPKRNKDTGKKDHF